MKVLVDLPEALFRRAYAHVESGRYPSLNDALVVALETQLVLEEAAEGPALVATRVIRGAIRGGATSEDALLSDRSGQRTQTRRVTVPAVRGCGGPLPEEIGGPAHFDYQTAQMPNLQTVGERRYWLWGVNRVAPVKAAMRIVVALAAKNGGRVALGTLHDLGGTIARRVGDVLAACDNGAGRKHGYRLSSGFPRSGSDQSASEKSSTRYAELVFGAVRKRSGRIDGALYELRLVSFEQEGDGSQVVVPTAPGLEFALLKSPVLDDEPGGAQRALSEEESAWYLRHAKTHVPQEYRVLIQAVRHIKAGRADAESFLDAMRRDYPNLSEKARSSLRVCILGRLLDIGLVERKAEGEYRLLRSRE